MLENGLDFGILERLIRSILLGRSRPFPFLDFRRPSWYKHPLAEPA
jgi:hypothetical protein